jgi:malate dehydrogenase (oxaloacetate-decarboxylating)
MTALHDRNEVLFYKLFTAHVKEMMPIVYDPVIGEAIEQYSHDYRRPRGIYLSIDEPEKIEESFKNIQLSAEDVDLIVATDAQEILGIGDWGVGGIDIAIGKLAVYTAVAGIHPSRVIPVMLDVGTDNETLLNDPLYMGYRHSRVQGERYDAFIESYVRCVRKLFPKALLHWEDFGPGNGRRILLKYREKFATFNDDMQGTGAIALAGIMNALKVAKTSLTDARVVIFGAGTAGVGIADQIRDAMVRNGLKHDKAMQQIWLIDKQGLLIKTMDNLRDYQEPYAREMNEVKSWEATGAKGKITLADVVKNVKPTILVGTSTTPHTFTQEIVMEMAKHCDRPIIFPLSNPTALIEASPADIIEWTKGKALVATGAPFPDVEYNGITYTIGQANNALLYPGLGLGTIVSQASVISDEMFFAAALAVANSANLNHSGAALLPSIDSLRAVSASVAVNVVKTAQEQGIAEASLTDIVQQVHEAMWVPDYPVIKN